MKTKLTFQFFDTKKSATKFSEIVFNNYSAYLKKRYGKPIPQLWHSKDKKERKWIVWFRG